LIGHEAAAPTPYAEQESNPPQKDEPMDTADIPAGFARHTRHSPFTSPWEPIYAKQTADAVILALRLAEPHTNARGLVHGGLIASLADNAMGLSCRLKADDAADGLVTVNLSVDYLGSAHVGQWLAVETGFVRAGGSLCFAQSFITADGKPCARANATFKILRGKS
jgi:uncharacterized protein (TIGR00369 family)